MELGEDEGGAPVGLETGEQVAHADVFGSVRSGEQFVPLPSTTQPGVPVPLPHPPAKLVEARVPGDGEEPGAGRRVAAIPRQGPDRPDERLLGQVVSAPLIDQGGAQSTDLVVARTDERLQGAGVAQPGGVGQAAQLVHDRHAKPRYPVGTKRENRSTTKNMRCDAAREAISALLDGEVPGASVLDVDRHLAACASCSSWREAAHEVTRRARIEPMPARVQRTDEVLAAVSSAGRLPRRPSTAALARVGLVVIAVAQIAITIPILVLGQDHSAPGHIAHEMGSFDAALAVGFLIAAWRPGRALGMRTLIGAAAVLLAVTAVIDLARGATDVLDEAPHVLALAGWLLVRHLAVVSPPTVEDPASQVISWLRSQVRVRQPSPAHLVGPEPVDDEHPPTAARHDRRAVG